MNITDMRRAIHNYELETTTLTRLLSKAPRTSIEFQDWCRRTADHMPLTTRFRYPDLKVGGDWHLAPAVRYTSVLALMVALGRVVRLTTTIGSVYQLPTVRE